MLQTGNNPNLSRWKGLILRQRGNMLVSGRVSWIPILRQRKRAQSPASALWRVCCIVLSCERLQIGFQAGPACPCSHGPDVLAYGGEAQS